MDATVITDGMTVTELIAKLGEYEGNQRFLVQSILPDGTAWSAPARVFEVPGSNCGDGIAYLGLQIRCDGGSKEVTPQTSMAVECTLLMDKIECPKCGHVHEPSGSHEDDSGEWTCHACEFKFNVEIEYSPEYYTT